MTRGALWQPAGRDDPNPKIHLSGFTYGAWVAGTRITTTVWAAAGERTVHDLACWLYVVPYDTTVGGGL